MRGGGRRELESRPTAGVEAEVERGAVGGDSRGQTHPCDSDEGLPTRTRYLRWGIPSQDTLVVVVVLAESKQSSLHVRLGQRRLRGGARRRAERVELGLGSLRLQVLQEQDNLVMQHGWVHLICRISGEQVDGDRLGELAPGGGRQLGDGRPEGGRNRRARRTRSERGERRCRQEERREDEHGLSRAEAEEPVLTMGVVVVVWWQESGELGGATTRRWVSSTDRSRGLGSPHISLGCRFGMTMVSWSPAATNLSSLISEARSPAKRCRGGHGYGRRVRRRLPRRRARWRRSSAAT